MPNHQRDNVRNSVGVKAKPLLLEGVTKAQLPAPFPDCETHRARVRGSALAVGCSEFLLRYGLAQLLLPGYNHFRLGRLIRVHVVEYVSWAFASRGEVVSLAGLWMWFILFRDASCTGIHKFYPRLSIHVLHGNGESLGF